MPYIHDMITNVARLHAKAREEALKLALDSHFGAGNWTPETVAGCLTVDHINGREWRYRVGCILICVIEAKEVRPGTGFVTRFEWGIFKDNHLVNFGTKTIKEGSNRW